MTALRDNLEQEFSQITKELETIAIQDEKTGDWIAQPETHTGEADENVSADTTEDWNERRATVAQLETRYHNLLIALKKFETGTFGKCEICNDQIESDRLNANPAARTCKIHLERERELPL